MNPRCHRDCRCQFGAGREDVSWITGDLAVGGIPHDFDVAALRDLGITHVLNVNWPDRPEYPEVVEAFVHRNLAILDDGKPKPPEWWASGIEFARTLGPGDKLLVHCGHGINRGPSMAYAILRSRGYGTFPAESIVRTARHQMGGETVSIYLASFEEYWASVA